MNATEVDRAQQELSKYRLALNQQTLQTKSVSRDLAVQRGLNSKLTQQLNQAHDHLDALQAQMGKLLKGLQSLDIPRTRQSGALPYQFGCIHPDVSTVEQGLIKENQLLTEKVATLKKFYNLKRAKNRNLDREADQKDLEIQRLQHDLQSAKVALEAQEADFDFLKETQCSCNAKQPNLCKCEAAQTMVAGKRAIVALRKNNKRHSTYRAQSKAEISNLKSTLMAARSKLTDSLCQLEQLARTPLKQECDYSSSELAALKEKYDQDVVGYKKQIEDLKTITIKDGHQFSDTMRLCYMELQSIPSLSGNVMSRVVETVFRRLAPKSNVTLQSLPGRTSVDNFRAELHEVGQMFIAHDLLQNYKEGATLQIDEATHKQTSVVASGVAHSSGKVFLGLMRVATHFSYEQLELMQLKYAEIKSCGEDMGYGESQVERDYACSPAMITCTMADQAKVQVKFNNMVAAIKKEKVEEMQEAPEDQRLVIATELQEIDSYGCFVHKIVNFASAEEAALVEHSKAHHSQYIATREDSESEEDTELYNPDMEEAIIEVLLDRGEGYEKEYLCKYVDKAFSTTAELDREWRTEEEVRGISALKRYKEGGVSSGSTRVSRTRTMSKFKQICWEIVKYFRIAGPQEDQHGEHFMTWMAGHDEYLQFSLWHKKLKPLIGNRYTVWGYNALYIYICLDGYAAYLAWQKSKKKSQNRLEASICRGFPLALPLP